MPNALSIDLLHALRATRASATACCKALRTPYEALVSAAPDVPPPPPPPPPPAGTPAIPYPTWEQAGGLEPLPAERPATRSEVRARGLGAPRRMSWTKSASPLKSLAVRVSRLGGVAHPLDAVLARQDELGSLLAAYDRGEFAGNTIESWLRQLDAFEKAFLADVDRAIAMCASYGKLATPAPKEKALPIPEIVTPKFAADHLGVGVPAVRKRIRNKMLGRWTKSGGTWYTTRDEFLRFLGGDQESDSSASTTAARRRAKSSAVEAVLAAKGRGRRGRKASAPPISPALVLPPPKKSKRPSS